MNPQIESIYKSRKVSGQNGVEHALHSEVDPAEGEFLHQVISQDPSISRTLEVGCAYGLSSLHICQALSLRPKPEHTIIDPFQYSHWDGVGIKNLESAGVRFFNLIQKRSELALPELLGLGATFDLIFIDGYHTFDHTLLDCFYATRLLRSGGYLVIDDVGMPPVACAVDYLSRYPCYELFAALSDPRPPPFKRRAARALLGLLSLSRRTQLIRPALLRSVFDDKHTRMVAFKKATDDTRDWDWFPAGF